MVDEREAAARREAEGSKRALEEERVRSETLRHESDRQVLSLLALLVQKYKY